MHVEEDLIKLSHQMGRKKETEAYASPYSVSASTRHLCTDVHNQETLIDISNKP